MNTAFLSFCQLDTMVGEIICVLNEHFVMMAVISLFVAALLRNYIREKVLPFIFTGRFIYLGGMSWLMVGMETKK